MTAPRSEDPQDLWLARHPRLRRLLLSGAGMLLLALFGLALLPLPSIAQAQETGNEDPLAASVKRFLLTQTRSLGDQVSVEVHDNTARLGPCAAPEPFLPRPGTPQGRVTVGVNCQGEGRARYVQATVSAGVRHLVAARTIEPGDPIVASVLAWRTSDVTRLQRGYLRDMPDAAGHVATRRIPAGATLTDAMVRQPWLVKRGDTVVLIAQGQGFRVSRSVEALENGGMGNTIRLKTEGNQILQGQVTGPDQLRVNF
ncbi:flagellar basal body P-ring formation chaperone FlgA [Salinicola sp. RZ23]|uniref:flagellar basal body P-ring formation chaperone FlgA n=1 Tax=Salinicola sp. RZ23 TaxID=1949087 RepID=UPI001300A43A|nr:flagellar basal body P-ring formation chaperone FlgA [Salinicola sp. RZ23]